MRGPTSIEIKTDDRCLVDSALKSLYNSTRQPIPLFGRKYLVIDVRSEGNCGAISAEIKLQELLLLATPTGGEISPSLKEFSDSEILAEAISRMKAIEAHAKEANVKVDLSQTDLARAVLYGGDHECNRE